jgi:hypothetical protein
MIALLQLEQAYLADHERRTRIMDAWRAYEGTLPKPLKVEPGEIDDNLVFAFGQTVVNKGVSFLFPDGISFEVDGQAKSDPDTWLAQCWEANRFRSLLLDIGINGGVCGDVFLRIKPAAKGAKFPRVIVLDPADVTVVTGEDDYREVIAYVVQWNTINRTTGKPVVRRQVIEREDADSTQWTITDYELMDGSRPVLRREPVQWPFEWAPILHCQNLPCPNSYYGYSDLEKAVVDLNKALNFTASNVNRILRFHAHPLTVATGLNGPGDLMTKVGSVLKLPNPNAKLSNLEMVSDLSSSLEHFRELKQIFHELSRIPEVATGKVEDLGQLSGLALQILYQPLLEKTRDKRVLYGELLEETGRCLLQLRQKTAQHTVKTHWPSVLPSDPKGDAETALLDQQLGVSRDTLLTRRGYDAEDEAKKRAKEAKAAKALGDSLLDQFDKGGGQDEEGDPEEDGGQ